MSGTGVIEFVCEELYEKARFARLVDYGERKLVGIQDKIIETRRCLADVAQALVPNATYSSWAPALIVGRSPWTWGPLWGRRPRRPVHALQDADPVVPAAGRGLPTLCQRLF